MKVISSIRLTGILVACLLLASCLLNSNRQYDTAFPVVLEFTNKTQHKFHSGLIYSTPEAYGGFNIPVNNLHSGKTRNKKVIKSVYDDIRGLHYRFEGTCGSNTRWKSDEKNSEIAFIESLTEWKISLSIINCGIDLQSAT